MTKQTFQVRLPDHIIKQIQAEEGNKNEEKFNNWLKKITCPTTPETIENQIEKDMNQLINTVKIALTQQLHEKIKEIERDPEFTELKNNWKHQQKETHDPKESHFLTQYLLQSINNLCKKHNIHGDNIIKIIQQHSQQEQDPYNLPDVNDL